MKQSEWTDLSRKLDVAHAPPSREGVVTQVADATEAELQEARAGLRLADKGTATHRRPMGAERVAVQKEVPPDDPCVHTGEHVPAEVLARLEE